MSAVSLALCAPLFGTLPAYAQDWCAGMVTDKDSRAVPRVDRPAARQSYVDATFGTRVTRVTDAPFGSARRTLYSTVQPWNADESLLVLYHTDSGASGHHLYDGQTYEYLRPLEFLASDVEEIYWDDRDSRTLYFVQKRPQSDPLFGQLVKYDVDTRERTLAADLDAMCGTAESRGGITARGGNDIQGMADGKIGLRCNNDNVTGNSSDITFYVDVRTGEISDPVTIDPSRPQGGNSYGFLPNIAASPMHSGERVFLQGSVYDADMNFLSSLDISPQRYTASDGRTYTVPKAEHASIGRLSNGHDAFFSSRYDVMENGCDGDIDSGQGAVVAQDAETGACRVLVGRSTGWGYPLSGVHVSTVSQRNLDWVTTTSVGYGNFDYFDNLRPAPPMFSELTLTEADLDDPTTCRVAHLRTTGKSASRGGYAAYFGEPHAVMSPSGSRVLFNSDWYDSGSVDTYAVELGTNTSAQVSSFAAATSVLTNAVRADAATVDETSADDVVAVEAPADETSVDDVVAVEAPADETPADETSADDAVAVEAPADETSADDAVAVEAPADEAPVDETSADEAVAVEASTDEAPADTTLASLSDSAPADPIPSSGQSSASEPVAVATPEAATEERDDPTMRVLVRTQASTPRVYVRFSDGDRGPGNRVTIAPVGYTDRQWKVWLYTNGTQKLNGPTPTTGRLSFYQLYIGSGQFEARLFTDGNYDEAVERVRFDIP